MKRRERKEMKMRLAIMKKLLTILILFVFIVPSLAFAGWVKGYYRKNGTYVAPHYRTSPNKSRTDNYSYPGNLNPNTGQITPWSNSPQKLYPTNPNPYNNQQNQGNPSYLLPQNNNSLFNTPKTFSPSYLLNDD